MEEVFRFTKKKHQLLTTQLLSSLHICTIALHVDIHLVRCYHVGDWLGGGGICWHMCLCLPAGRASKGPTVITTDGSLGNVMDRSSHFDLGPVASIHPFSHSFIHSFIHPSIHPPILTSTRHPIHPSSHPLIHPSIHSSMCRLYYVALWISQRE